MVFEEMIGSVITGLDITPEKDCLVFYASDKRYVYTSKGDCCSQSWFQGITGLDRLLGGTVRRVIVREMPEGQNDPALDYLQFYGWTIETDKGLFDIEMRNASNGYYGGWAAYQPVYFPDELRAVTEDFF